MRTISIAMASVKNAEMLEMAHNSYINSNIQFSKEDLDLLKSEVKGWIVESRVNSCLICLEFDRNIIDHSHMLALKYNVCNYAMGLVIDSIAAAVASRIFINYMKEN